MRGMELKNEIEEARNYIFYVSDYIDTSSSYEFLKYIRPKFAVISCGLNNKYNHPSASVIDTLNSLNIKYIRTDLNGTFIYKC